MPAIVLGYVLILLALGLAGLVEYFERRKR